MLLLLAAQASQAQPPEPINLLAPPPTCGSDTGNADVTVCGRRDKDRYRIRPQYRTPPDEGLGRAETRIGNVGVSAVTEQGDVGGIPTNRVMIRIKIPL